MGCTNIRCHGYKLSFELHHQHPSHNCCKYAGIICCQEVRSGMGSLGMICGFPQLELLGFPNGRARHFRSSCDATAGRWVRMALRDGKVPRSRQWRPFVSVLSGRFLAQKGPRMKGTVLGDVAGPNNCVAILVIFGTFLKTWFLEVGGEITIASFLFQARLSSVVAEKCLKCDSG